MEEEQKVKSEPKEKEFKIFLASYSPELPSEIISILKKDSFNKNNNLFSFIQDHHLEFIQVSNKSAIQTILNLYPGENHTDILCKIYEVEYSSLHQFLIEKIKKPDLINFLKQKETFKEFACEFQAESQSKIGLFYVGDYQNFPLISVRNLESKKISNIFDPEFSKDVLDVLKHTISYFKEFLDKKSAHLYIRKISFESQKKVEMDLLVENILNEVYSENDNQPKILNNEEKIMFQLKTKEFRKEKLLEIPKFKKELGNFDPQEKLKLILDSEK